MKAKIDFKRLMYNVESTLYNMPKVIILVEHLLNDYPDFYHQSGSGYEGQHHYGDGGLAQHTYEVLEYCIENAKLSGKNIKLSVLILAALYHDIGKLWDYERNPDFENVDNLDEDPWTPTKHKRNIHHISKSAMIFYEQANKVGLDEDTREAVLHCILSHHTSRAHGSPVAPNSREAWILTLCDNMSARMYDCDTWDYLKK